jgi:hypothetical protein
VISLTAVDANVARVEAVLAAAGKLVEYVQPPMLRSTFKPRLAFLRM